MKGIRICSDRLLACPKNKNHGRGEKNIRQNSPAQGQAPAGSYTQPDAPRINDSKASVANDELTQGPAGHELNPEFGDAADPRQQNCAPAAATMLHD